MNRDTFELVISASEDPGKLLVAQVPTATGR